MAKGQLIDYLYQEIVGCTNLPGWPSDTSAAPQTFLHTVANYSLWSLRGFKALLGHIKVIHPPY